MSWREIGVDECQKHVARPNSVSSSLLLVVKGQEFQRPRPIDVLGVGRRSNECRIESRSGSGVEKPR